MAISLFKSRHQKYISRRAYGDALQWHLLRNVTGNITVAYVYYVLEWAIGMEPVAFPE